MSSQTAFVSSAATSLVTTAETAVLTFTVPPENNPAGQGIFIDVNCVVTSGASVTALQIRVRQGTGVSGALVGVMAQTQVAASTSNEQCGGAFVDPTLAYPAGNTYTVTVQQVAATGNGAMVQVIANTAPVTSLAG